MFKQIGEWKSGVLLLGLIVLLAGCRVTDDGWGPNQTAGTLFGGASGGFIGAAIGSQNGKTAEGALIGGLAGAVLGNALGGEADAFEERSRQELSRDYQDQLRGALSHDQIIQMVHSGLSDEVIANQIHNQGIVRRPQAQELIFLKSQGIPDRVLAAMQSAWVPGEAPRGWRPGHYGPPPVVVYEDFDWMGPPIIYRAPRYYCPLPRRPGTYWGFSFGF